MTEAGAPAVSIPAALVALWSRVIATSPAPAPIALVVVPAVVALLVAIPATWHPLRHGITIVHEAGHGFTAMLGGRRLAGIRLHSDTSGLTVSVGQPRGAGMVLTLLAGYPAPSAAGVLVAWAVAAGHAALALWGALVLLAAVLVQIRNWFGLLSVLVSAALVGAATWLLDSTWQATVALGLATLLLLGGLRTAFELPASRRRDRRGTSDPDQLARITVLPAWLWQGAFLLLALAGLAGGAWLVGGSSLLTLVH